MTSAAWFWSVCNLFFNDLSDVSNKASNIQNIAELKIYKIVWRECNGDELFYSPQSSIYQSLSTRSTRKQLVGSNRCHNIIIHGDAWVQISNFIIQVRCGTHDHELDFRRVGLKFVG
jgi:hypothetical protein